MCECLCLLLPWWLEVITDTGLTEGGYSLEFWAPTWGTAALKWSHCLCCMRKDQHFALSKTEISYWLEQHFLCFFLYTHTWIAWPGIKSCLYHSLEPLSLCPFPCVSPSPSIAASLSLLPSSLLCPPVFLLPLILSFPLSLSLSPLCNTIQICLRCTEKNSKWRSKDEFQR